MAPASRGSRIIRTYVVTSAPKDHVALAHAECLAKGDHGCWGIEKCGVCLVRARACAAVLAKRLDAILSADGENDGVFDQLFALLAELEPSTDAEGGRERG